MPANYQNVIEMAVYGGNDPDSFRTVHLFRADQPGAKTGDDYYRTICGDEFVASRCRIARGEPICQRCVRIENTCACTDGPHAHN